ncbi:S8 family peptidase [Sphingomonas sp. LY54]|uniref:S8 family peptidase n=1 Tax=Sphingomonas sp. LY54 TaxID=3095343 RepID=UPI002D768BA3|nr:S8 family peptidase [Sphingomonas sp. LY54]WRP27446.1 S8 family peptidase [Sphingomonas sp. LY54]
MNYNDAEYGRSNGASAAGAISAYNAGGRGQGITIGIVDSGINPALPEFAGRIHPASQDVAANRGVVDTEGHGTAVAGTAAAARNGSGMMGVAFESRILSLNTAKATDCDPDDGCQHSDADIARAIDIARGNGARVINISLGGESAGSTVLGAISRATAAGIVIVMSAGNEGKEATGGNPGGFALQSAQRAGNGLVIIAGAHDAARQLADFSNRAGTGATHYLTALGTQIRTFDHNGQALLYSGTSFSTPIISGAVALLASAFPNLTGAQIVRLLLTTADDAGAVGVDGVFGNGILNIARAFQPQGQTSLAGSSMPVSTTDNGQGSGAMGDATGKMAGAIILDGYSRAYAVDLARTLARAPQERPLAQSLAGRLRTASAGNGALSVTLTVDRRFDGRPMVGLAQTGLSYEDSREAKAVAGIALSRITPQTAVAFGFSESGRTLQQRLSGHHNNAFLVARDPMARSGFQADAGSAVGVRQMVGPLGVTVTAERGEIWNQGVRQSLRQPGYSISTVTADHRIGPALVSVGLSRLDEESTTLGGRFSSAFAGGGAATTFADASASFDLGRGWGAFASYRRGWTGLAGTGALVDRGRLSTDAWAFDVAKTNAFVRGDKLAFRVMQPLRVRSGGFDVTMPVSYDYDTGAVGYEQRFFNLAPTGREIDFEAAYSVGLLGGDLGANLFLRKEPGHVEAMGDDIGGAIRFTLGF